MKRATLGFACAVLVVLALHVSGARAHTAVVAGGSTDISPLLGIGYAIGWIGLWLLGPPLSVALLVARWQVRRERSVEENA
jgi:hypothetical protein